MSCIPRRAAASLRPLRILQVHVGDTIDEMGRRFVAAWHRAERGELTPLNAERHVGFATFEIFSRIMRPKRLELLRHLHRHPARSIRALAAALGRDYSRVHADVDALAAAGLLDRDERGLHGDYQTVKMETTIAL